MPPYTFSSNFCFISDIGSFIGTHRHTDSAVFVILIRVPIDLERESRVMSVNFLGVQEK